MIKFELVMKRRNLLYVLALTFVLCTSCLDDSGADLPSLWETLNNDPSYSTFVSAAEKTGVDGVLKQDLFMTLFVPNNTVFNRYLDENNISSIDDIDNSTLENLLRYHIQLTKARASEIQENYYLTGSAGGADSTNLSIYFATRSGELTINNNITLTQIDIEARNGYIHQVSDVIPLPNIATLLEANESGDVFWEILEDYGLENLVSSGEHKTIFAPTANALEIYYNDKGVDDFEDMPEEEVKNILRYHIAPGNHRSQEYNTSFVDLASFLPGKEIKVGFSGDVFVVNPPEAAATFADIQGINGALHYITSVLEPE